MSLIYCLIIKLTRQSQNLNKRIFQHTFSVLENNFSVKTKTVNRQPIWPNQTERSTKDIKKLDRNKEDLLAPNLRPKCLLAVMFVCCPPGIWAACLLFQGWSSQSWPQRCPLGEKCNLLSKQKCVMLLLVSWVLKSTKHFHKSFHLQCTFQITPGMILFAGCQPVYSKQFIYFLNKYCWRENLADE